MIKFFKIFSITATIFLSMAPILIFSQDVNSKKTKIVSAFDLQIAIRNVLDEQSILSRSVMLSIVDTLPEESQAIEQLINSQDAIGNMLIPYFGVDATSTFIELLYCNINFSIEVFKAAKVDSIVTNAALKKWLENSARIDRFVSKNFFKNVPVDLKLFVRENVSLTYNEMQDHVNGNLEGDSLNFEKIRSRNQQFANKFSMSIVKQFPDRFASGQNNIVKN